VPEIASDRLSIDPSRLPPGGRVADIGAGDGRHTEAAARRGCCVVAVDYDLEALRGARARGVAAAFVAADAARLPFRNGVFDAVICTETLEHLPDDVAAIAEIARTLRDGGTLLGAVPSHFTDRAYFALSPGYRTAPGGHVRIYAPRDLLSKLRRAGLGISSYGYVHFIDSIVWLRFCLTDFLRPRRRRTPFEQAVMLAVAAERPVPSWRRRLRAAMARSRVIAALDTAGAFVWPKSFTFVARKGSRTVLAQPPSRPGRRVARAPTGRSNRRSARAQRANPSPPGGEGSAEGRG